MLVGYARVSTRDQSPVLQLDALHEAGCERVFTEKASGAARDRPELKAALAGLAKAKALGRRGGRKPTMGPAEIKRAKAMLADPEITVEEVAQQIGVRPSTLYRHIPGGRSSLVEPAL